MVRATLPVLEKTARRQLRLVLKRAHGIAELKKRVPSQTWQADISLIGPEEMKALNAHYRKRRYATDILSFETPSAFRKQGFLGELVICHSVLKRQAKENAHSVTDELKVLIVHGVLHLLAFDHEKGPRHARVMRGWEDRLLNTKKAPKAKTATAGGLIGRTLKNRA
jgi:rRNA maturation RNase YbeY